MSSENAFNADFCEVKGITKDELEALKQSSVPWKRVPAATNHKVEGGSQKGSARDSFGGGSEDTTATSPARIRPVQAQKKQKIMNSADTTVPSEDDANGLHIAHSTPTPQSSTEMRREFATDPFTSRQECLSGARRADCETLAGIRHFGLRRCCGCWLRVSSAAVNSYMIERMTGMDHVQVRDDCQSSCVQSMLQD
ncbi:hypothetical protein LTR78_001760 [Recurvomyces mirabilis]|uniref:Uncharacterized protein n=1 Tax=Recurvomyces mirabilis TaxID=574656 RepID=A0AAE0WV86_9PEZI|nr:hypothetical protein LTR78_001760 [Recurvomyces mirabilis]KAK5150165.1 hypothetical protein LTS14_010294 [Recurvomyces mirabilis]